jgi:3-oxoacyl-[acyl-carrier protein] reductase
MKTIVITGAGKGIGRATAILAARKGYKVIGLSRNINEIKGIKNLYSYSIDITEAESLKRITDTIKSKFSKIDILINNAGVLLNLPFTESSIEKFKKIYEVNVFGLAEITRLILPFINNDGHVINISSMGGVQGSSKFSGLSAYSSSKGAVITLTELLSEEYKNTGPSFNVLALGAVQTEMLELAFPGYKAPVSSKEFAEYLLNFALNGHKFYNGKILPISSSNP